MKLAERLILLGFEPGLDFDVRDDGAGPYLHAWLSDRPQPSQAAIAAAAPAPPVPEAISDRQFAQILALDGVISQDEALAWAARGDLPDALEDALTHVPEAGGQRFGARMLLSSATTYERAHPLVPLLGALLVNPATGVPYGAGDLDSLWTRGAVL